MKLVCTSEAPHTKIFQDLTLSGNRIIPKEHLTLMDDLGLLEKSEDTKSINIFTGQEEIFASERTISRLSEMMTKQYWSLCDSRQR